MGIDQTQQTRRARERVFALALAFVLLASVVATLALSRSATMPITAVVTTTPDDSAAQAALKAYVARQNLFRPTLAPASRTRALRDVESRLDPAFRVPRGMENLVGFWLGIYAEYSSEQRVLYDINHPEIVYEVLDFRGVSETAPSRAAYEIVARKRIADAVKAYKHAFKRLAGNPSPRDPSREELRVIAAVKKSGHAHGYRLWGAGFRIQTGQRDNIVRGLANGAPYFPKMQSLFSIMGVPPELTRLSLVESSFNLNAVSRVGAAGVWQFMRDPGYKWLRIDDAPAKGQAAAANLIDERLSPLKSAVAAARLLESNYRILGNWPLATTSYNHGFTSLPKWPRGADPATIGRLFSLCPRGNRMGYASANFYAEFLAVLHADRYRELFYGEPPVVGGQGSVTFRRVETATTAERFAGLFDIPVRRFRELNPDLIGAEPRLPTGYLAAVPSTNDNLVALIETTSTPNPAPARVASRGARLASFKPSSRPSIKKPVAKARTSLSRRGSVTTGRKVSASRVATIERQPESEPAKIVPSRNVFHGRADL